MAPQKAISSPFSLRGSRSKSAFWGCSGLPGSPTPDVGEGRKVGWEGSRRRGGGVGWGGGGVDGNRGSPGLPARPPR